MIKHLENESDFESLIKEGVVLVDFYAEWCGPCKMMGKVLEELSEVNIVKVNTDEFQNLAMKFGVMSIPTLVFFKNGVEVKKEIGFKDKATILNLLNEIN